MKSSSLMSEMISLPNIRSAIRQLAKEDDRTGEGFIHTQKCLHIPSSSLLILHFLLNYFPRKCTVFKIKNMMYCTAHYLSTINHACYAVDVTCHDFFSGIIIFIVHISTRLLLLWIQNVNAPFFLPGILICSTFYYNHLHRYILFNSNRLFIIFKRFLNINEIYPCILSNICMDISSLYFIKMEIFQKYLSSPPPPPLMQAVLRLYIHTYCK